MSDKKKLFSKIIECFSNRKGFDDWWGNLDYDLQKEIEEDLFNRINR